MGGWESPLFVSVVRAGGLMVVTSWLASDLFERFLQQVFCGDDTSTD